MFKLLAFGDPCLRDEEGNDLNGITRQTKRFALLIFLACDSLARPHRRDEIISTFWPDSDGSKARNALRQSLHVIRGELGPEIVQANGSEDLSVDRTWLSCDVETFVEAIASGFPEKALGVYKADFLLGFDLPGCPEFGSWADERRSDLRRKAASAAKDLAHQSEGVQDSSSALFWWRRALLHRPFDEAVIRRIGSLLAWSENRGEAAAEIEAFNRRMVAQLGVAPSRETMDLLDKISAGRIDEVNQWVGDRRGHWMRNSEPHRRRPGDPRPV
jgi:DNA-binding SARP family transcriptional activator